MSDELQVVDLAGDRVELAVAVAAGPRGPAGADGAAGADGTGLTVTAGTVTTGAAGSQATAQVVSTGPAAYRIDLTIPRGNAGADGSAGAAGSAGPAGVDGKSVELRATADRLQWRLVGTTTWGDLVLLSAITGPAGANGTNGSAGAAGAAGTSITGATVDGTGHLILTLSTGATLDAGVVKGADGAAGTTGAAGPANTLTIGTVTTGPAGTSASASVTGTAPNQTLSLTIPRGAAGADGAAGAAAPSAVVAPPLGRWWTPGDSQPGTLTPAAAGAMYLFPIMLPACTLQNVAIDVSSGTASALVRVGMYADASGGGPNLTAPLWDGGTQDASTPGIKTYACTLTLTAGVYWMAVVAQGAIPIIRAGLRGYGVTMPLPSGQSPLGGASASACLMWAITGITGTLPSAPATTPSQQNTNVPKLWFQRSAT